MRRTFIHTLCELAEKDDRICLIVGDLGFSVVEPFAKRFPDRFINAGVAEQNMIGVATGLSLSENKIVFVYSIANFTTLRCLEQIRNDVCYHKCNVKIVGVGGGVTYGTAGYSHFATEDLAIMRALPGIVVSVPADTCEVSWITKLAVSNPGPFYIRLGGNEDTCLHENFENLHSNSIGDPIVYKDKGDIVLIGIGAILNEVLRASEVLELSYNIKCSVVGVPFIKPINVDKIKKILENARIIFTVEEHIKYGGLFSSISEILAFENIKKPIYPLHLPELIETVGSQKDLRRLYKVDCDGIVSEVLETIFNTHVS